LNVKAHHALIWVGAVLVVYVLGSGPALLLEGTPTWDALRLDKVYWPLSRLVLTPAYRILLPYWDLWHDDRDTNPLIPG